ncbi:MAG: HD domain-containing protein [Firmicutes bacterium]|nr:HD domain-containing protein [Bacillota bacterium]
MVYLVLNIDIGGVLIIKNYLQFKPSFDLKEDIKQYFSNFNSLETYNHSLDVLEELSYIEKVVGVVDKYSYIACLCHDLGRVVAKEDIVLFCRENNIHITEEEKLLPSILHQRISKFITENVFKIENEKILNAIGYHTTSRKKPSNIEMEVFLADKLSFREKEFFMTVKGIRNSLKNSKEEAMLYYLTELYKKKNELRLYHTDAYKAYKYFKKLLKD